MVRHIPPWLRRAIRREDGNATIEFVIWFPVFIAIIGLLMDATMVMHGRSQTLRIVEDANRMRAIGTLATDEETQDWIQATLTTFITDEARVQTTVEAGLVTSVVELPIRDLQLLGVLGSMTGNFRMNVGARQSVEYWDEDTSDEA